MRITSIETTDVARITSGQVIIELLSVVKELVENSIDAKGDKIDVTFQNYGIGSVEISDNGSGIEKEDFESLCLKHYTSKLETFEDLSHVNTLGFRGEAMSSLCSVAKIKISTCTKSSYPKATELEYDHLGRLLSQKTRVTGKRGTTVTVSSLFHDMPVRQKNFVKHAKREYSKCLSVLMGYLLGYTHIRFAVYNVSDSTGKKNMALGSRGGNSKVSDVLTSIFGSNGAHGLVAVEMVAEDIDARFKLSASTVPISLSMKVSGWISDYSFGMGRGGADRQFLYINKRPVTHKRFTKVINEVYRSFNTTQSPVYVINIEISSVFLDQNVTPDKRMVMVQSEEVLCEVLREELAQFYEMRHNSVPKNDLRVDTQRLQDMMVKLEQGSSQISRPEDGGLLPATSEAQPQEEKVIVRTHAQKPGEAQVRPMPDALQVRQLVRPTAPTISVEDKREPEAELVEIMPPTDSGCESATESTEQIPEILGDESVAIVPKKNSHGTQLHELDGAPNSALSLPHHRSLSAHVSLLSLQDHVDAQAFPIQRDDTRRKNRSSSESENNSWPNTRQNPHHASVDSVDDFGDVSEKVLESLFVEDAPTVITAPMIQVKPAVAATRCSMQRAYCLKKLMSSPAPSEQERTAYQPLLASVQDIQQTLEIHKGDFASMQVVGQFNLGFVVVVHVNRLFIVDQHALDEIYNYERLMESLVLRAQPLVVPRVLELSPIDEMVLLENIQSLRRNGFVVEENVDEVPGRRVRLIALPVLKNVVFDDGDLHELMHKLHENGFSHRALLIELRPRRTVRCTKVDGMIALRACRKSIMIGQSLTKCTMARIVCHLSELEKPWNCPHGRPTMRHLADLEHLRFDADYIL